VALWAYALRTVVAAKAALNITGTNIDSVVEAAVNEASQLVEGAWGTEIVSRGSVTEYYTFYARDPSCHVLYPNQRPIVSITSINEDATRVFGGSTLLVVNTDYIVSQPASSADGKIIRVANSLPQAWTVGWRAVKVVGIFGFKDTAGVVSAAQDVHPVILDVFDDLTAWIIRHRTKGEVGTDSSTDAMGTRTLWQGPPMVTEGMKTRLASIGALSPTLRGVYGERDA